MGSAMHLIALAAFPGTVASSLEPRRTVDSVPIKKRNNKQLIIIFIRVWPDMVAGRAAHRERHSRGENN